MGSANLSFPQADPGTQATATFPQSGQPAQSQLTPQPQPDTQAAQHGFFHALRQGLQSVALGAMPGVARAVQQKHENEREQENDLRSRQAKDLEWNQFLNESGAKPVVSGTVKEDLPLSDGTVIPGGFLRKAGDQGRHIVRHKTAEGETIQYELPTPEEAIDTHAKRLTQQFNAQIDTMRKEAEFKAQAAGAGEFYKKTGQLSAEPGVDPTTGNVVSPTAGQSPLANTRPPLMPRGTIVGQEPPIAGNPVVANATPQPAPAFSVPASLSHGIQQGRETAAKVPGEQVETLNKQLDAAAEDMRANKPTNQAEYDAILAKHPEAAAQMQKNFNQNFADSFVRTRNLKLKEEPEYDIKKAEADAMKMSTPESEATTVDSLVPAARYPELNRSTKILMANARSTGLPAAAKAAILKDTADQVASIAKEKDPEVMRARVNQEVAKQRALNALAPSSLAHVDPKFYSAATAQYVKTGEELSKAQTAAEDVQTVLDMALAGNKAAGANAPLVGVGAANAVNGIKRINSAEIHQYGTAGSLLDKIQGALTGWTEGKPISDSVLEDMKAFHEAISKGAAAKHGRDVETINKTYNSEFSPMNFGAHGGTAATPAAVPANVKKALTGAKPGIHKLSDGSSWMTDANGTISQAAKQ